MDTAGETYDFYSIMHYKLDHFSTNGSLTTAVFLMSYSR